MIMRIDQEVRVTSCKEKDLKGTAAPLYPPSSPLKGGIERGWPKGDNTTDRSATVTRGRGGFKSPKKFADVICEWPLMGKKRAAEMRSDSAEFFPSHFSCFRPNGSVWLSSSSWEMRVALARLLSLGAKKEGWRWRWEPPSETRK